MEKTLINEPCMSVGMDKTLVNESYLNASHKENINLSLNNQSFESTAVVFLRDKGANKNNDKEANEKLTESNEDVFDVCNKKQPESSKEIENDGNESEEETPKPKSPETKTFKSFLFIPNIKVYHPDENEEINKKHNSLKKTLKVSFIDDGK